MTLTPIEIAAYVAAGITAGSRLLNAARPLWDRLPKWAGVAIPIVVANVPQILTAFGAVHTSVDLTQAVVVTAALLLPGVQDAERALQGDSKKAA